MAAQDDASGEAELLGETRAEDHIDEPGVGLADRLHAAGHGARGQPQPALREDAGGREQQAGT